MSETFTYEQILAEAMAEPRQLVTVERQGARATVTMADPGRLNALTAALMWQLHQRLQELAADPGIRVVVLTGADPAFSAGGDLELIAAQDDADVPGGGGGAVGSGEEDQVAWLDLAGWDLGAVGPLGCGGAGNDDPGGAVGHHGQA